RRSHHLVRALELGRDGLVLALARHYLTHHGEAPEALAGLLRAVLPDGERVAVPRLHEQRAPFDRDDVQAVMLCAIVRDVAAREVPRFPDLDLVALLRAEVVGHGAPARALLDRLRARILAAVQRRVAPSVLREHDVPIAEFSPVEASRLAPARLRIVDEHVLRQYTLDDELRVPVVTFAIHARRDAYEAAIRQH